MIVCLHREKKKGRVHHAHAKKRPLSGASFIQLFAFCQMLAATSQLLFSKAYQTLGDFATYRTVLTGGGVRAKNYAEFSSDFILQLVKRCVCLRNYQVVGSTSVVCHV